MRFYQQQHGFYWGVDLHARSMHVCLVDREGQTKALLPTRGGSPQTSFSRAASRDVWRDARPLGPRSRARSLRNSPPRSVTRDSPERSRHETQAR